MPAGHLFGPAIVDGRSSGQQQFINGRPLWMNNGRLDQIEEFKRPLISLLSDKALQRRPGQYRFRTCFLKFAERPSAAQMHTAMIATTEQITTLRLKYQVSTNACMNFGATDDHTTRVTRLTSNSGTRPGSQFYAGGTPPPAGIAEFRLQPTANSTSQVRVITSAPLTDRQDDWIEVNPDHMVAGEGSPMKVFPRSVRYGS